MRQRIRRDVPRDTYYPPVTCPEASTWRDIHAETVQARPRGLKRLLDILLVLEVILAHNPLLPAATPSLRT